MDRLFSAATVLLLLCAVSVGGRMIITFPVLHTNISDCILLRCDKSINSCMESYGSLTPYELKGCVVQKCRGITKKCVKEFFKGILPYLPKVGPNASTLQTLHEIAFDELPDPYLQCWQETDLENTRKITDCFLNSLLERAKPLIGLLSPKFFSDPAYVACWVYRALKALISCYGQFEDGDFEDLLRQLEMAMKRNLTAYVGCLGGLSTLKPECDEMFERLFAPPRRRRQFNDYFLCTAHSAIAATAEC